MSIVVEGTVGAGKSTLAKKLSDKLEIPIYLELQDQLVMDILEKFYKDKTRWAFTLQTYFLNQRFRMIKDISKNRVGILDRSIFGDKIFANIMNEDGHMSNIEYDTYCKVFNNILEGIPDPDLLVYIDCSLETSIERIGLRGREMEQHEKKIYWDRLNNKYKYWYSSYNLNKISIDARSYNPNNDEDIDRIVDVIKSKLPTNYFY